jgi:NAD-dependent SIR2 family protein deacetylase
MKDNTQWRKLKLRATCPDGHIRAIHEALETLECSHCHRAIHLGVHFTKREHCPVCITCEPFQEHESNIEVTRVIPSDESIKKALELYGETEDYQEWLSLQEGSPRK